MGYVACRSEHQRTRCAQTGSAHSCTGSVRWWWKPPLEQISPADLANPELLRSQPDCRVPSVPLSAEYAMPCLKDTSTTLPFPTGKRAPTGILRGRERNHRQRRLRHIWHSDGWYSKQRPCGPGSNMSKRCSCAVCAIRHRALCPAARSQKSKCLAKSTRSPTKDGTMPDSP